MIIRRQVVYFLAFVGLVVSFVYVSHSRHSTTVADVSDNVEKSTLNITRGLDLTDQIDRDFHLCEHVSLETNVTSKYQIRLQSYSHTLQHLVPHTFSPLFKNPCWYSQFPYPNDRCKPIRTKMLQNFKKSEQNKNLNCLPSFFLAGFPKCGSTTLYRMIKQHPDIVPPITKEGQFWPTFTQKDGNKRTKMKSFLWYLLHFCESAQAIQSKPQKITLDASTQTLCGYYFKKRSKSEICIVPSMVKNVLPNAKFIVIMRDPAQRLLSHYWYKCKFSHGWKERKDPVGYYGPIAQNMFHNITAYSIGLFQSCIKKGISSFECVQNIGAVDHNGCAPLHLAAGMYYYHIVPWLIVYPYKNFLFLRTEDLVSSPDTVMKKVWAFLGLNNVPITPLWENMWITSDPKYKEEFTMLPETKLMLDKFYQPHNELLQHLLSDTRFMWK